ncbi:MAG: molybdopterin molybdotransferase MoeA [Salinibacterium sp.]|nr:molybdopterin molybdotransferase MoeA [Salinibacterium sp.]
MTQGGDEGSAPRSITEHRDHILATIRPLAPATVPLHEALGHTLAADLHADVNVPGFDNSAMDGYAVRLADVTSAAPDTPVTLRVVADLPAGASDDPALSTGEVTRIMTGAPVPTDADCIVPIEDTDEGTVTVTIVRAPTPAAHIRRTGTDVQAGDLVLPAGRVLGPRDLAAAAATGASGLLVHPAPRIGVISTGSELRDPGEPLGRGQIFNSNSVLLAALVNSSGGIPVQLGSVPDDEDALRTMLDRAAPSIDAFVTSGGVSVGAYDVVKAVLAPMGVWFGPVRMQPGKPQGFGSWPGPGGAAGPPIFALPGNPVSVFVSFEAFVRPALLALQGQHDVLQESQSGVATAGWRSPIGRTQYMPVVARRQADGTLAVRPASSGGSGSYLVASLAGANGLAIVPEAVTEVRIGDAIEVILIP